VRIPAGYDIHDDSDPGVEPCPSRGGTSGVRVLSDAPPGVLGWSCTECSTQWWITALTPHPRPWLDQLARDGAVRAVLQDITTLAGHVDTLTEGQWRARLIRCLARLDQIGRYDAAGLPAGHRPDTAVPGAQPVPRSTLAAPESSGTAIAR
jgi:hypothetical protein